MPNVDHIFLPASTKPLTYRGEQVQRGTNGWRTYAAEYSHVGPDLIAGAPLRAAVVCALPIAVENLHLRFNKSTSDNNINNSNHDDTHERMKCDAVQWSGVST